MTTRVSDEQQRVTRLEGKWPVGALGRAIQDRGGEPLSVDPSGMGVVLVGQTGARSVRDTSDEVTAGRRVPWQLPVMVLSMLVIAVSLWPRAEEASVPVSDVASTAEAETVTQPQPSDAAPPRSSTAPGEHAQQRRAARRAAARRRERARRARAQRARVRERRQAAVHRATTPATTESEPIAAQPAVRAAPVQPARSPEPAGGGGAQLVPVH